MFPYHVETKAKQSGTYDKTVSKDQTYLSRQSLLLIDILMNLWESFGILEMFRRHLIDNLIQKPLFYTQENTHSKKCWGGNTYFGIRQTKIWIQALRASGWLCRLANLPEAFRAVVFCETVRIAAFRPLLQASIILSNRNPWGSLAWFPKGVLVFTPCNLVSTQQPKQTFLKRKSDQPSFH